MHLATLLLSVLPALLPVSATAQTTLNKCIDADGRVTYSNLPCRGAREVQRVEIDPPPPPRPAAAPTPAVAPVPAAPAPAAAPPTPAGPPPTSPEPPPAAPAGQPATPAVSHPVPAQPAARPASPAQSAPPPSATKPAPLTPATCDALNERLGRVLDQMDAARGKDVSPTQLDTWNREVQTLERRKTEAGCF